MDINELLQYSNTLLKTALSKTHNIDEANELVQETYMYALVTLSKGMSIDNPKAYLSSVLHNRFFLTLRQKYKISTVSYDELPFEISDCNDNFESVFDTDEAVIIRRELAYLTNIYREVMVRYYMQNQSVAEIAKVLSIPRGTVLSRLDIGRKKVKKGVEKMSNYEKYSYQPDILYLGMNGRVGLNNEPFSCIKGSLDQNILILAYEKPQTTDELSKALGVPTAFIEESVNNLVASQLMKHEGTKFYTDFVIYPLEDSLKSLESSKSFANDTFNTANPVFLNMVKKYEELDGFSVFSDTQLYILAVLSSRQNYMSRVSEAVAGKLPEFDDYPDRPNFGKWVALGSKYPHGYDFNDERAKYNISGRSSTNEINEYIYSTCEWDTPIGFTHNAQFKYSLSQKERTLLIDAVRTNTITAFQAELIPDLEKYGFIKNENGKIFPIVPYITKDEENRFFEIEKEGSDEYCKLLLDKAVYVARNNILKYPKRISFVPDFIYSDALFYLGMAYIYEAVEKGIITLGKDRYYPIMYMVKR